jgi:hypothetical protein
MQTQHRRGELMQIKDPLNPAMINRDLVTWCQDTFSKVASNLSFM